MIVSQTPSRAFDDMLFDVGAFMCVGLCVCVYVRADLPQRALPAQREREGERKRERNTQTHTNTHTQTHHTHTHTLTCFEQRT